MDGKWKSLFLMDFEFKAFSWMQFFLDSTQIKEFSLLTKVKSNFKWREARGKETVNLL